MARGQSAPWPVAGSARGSLGFEPGEHLDDTDQQPLGVLAGSHGGKAKGSNEIQDGSTLHR